jgi:hypothetical protein
MLCKYKDIFGKPNEGVHAHRFMCVAIVDVIATIIGGYIIAYIFNFDVTNTIIILFLLGIILHKLFCVNTTINKILFNEV